MAIRGLRTSWNGDPILIRIFEIIIGFVMVVSAWLHLQNQMLFYIHVAQYKLLPNSLLPFFVITTPWILLFAGTLIVSRCGQPVGSIVGALLFFAFTVAQAFVMWSGYSIDCGCFGAMFNEKIGVATVLQSACLFLGCVFVTWSYRNRFTDGQQNLRDGD